MIHFKLQLCKSNYLIKNKEFCFRLDRNNYIKFCPERGVAITNWVSDGKEILYFDENRFMDKTKSIRGGIPILFPICGNLSISNSLFGKDYLPLMQHGFARDLHWQHSFNEKSLCLFLNESKKTKKYYPFDFELRINVTLRINCLEFEIVIPQQNRHCYAYKFWIILILIFQISKI